MTMQREEIGRLAMRREGQYWVAYYAARDTMDDAVCLGSIAMGMIVNRPALRSAFLEVMKQVIATVIEERTGRHAGWKEPEVAPEHERSGQA